MDPRNIPEIEKLLFAAQNQYSGAIRQIYRTLGKLESYNFLSTHLYPASYSDDEGHLMLAKKLVDAGDNIAQSLKDFPGYDEWREIAEQHYRDAYREFEQEEDAKRWANLSYYDSQSGTPPSSPDTSESTYEIKKSEYNAERVKNIESFKAPDFKVAIETIKQAQDSMRRSQADVQKYSDELTAAIKVFLTKTQEIVGNLNFWNKQGKGFFHGLFKSHTKTPDAIEEYRKILNNKTTSRDVKWEAIQNLATSKLKENESRAASDKSPEVLIRLHEAILSKDLSLLAKVANEVQPTLDVRAAKPKFGGDSEQSF